MKALKAWAEAGKIRPNISHRLPLEDYAQGDAAVDRSQGDRARGADDAVISVMPREGGASSTPRPPGSKRRRRVYWITRLRG